MRRTQEAETPMLERLVAALIGLGVPGFILFVLATYSGLAGGAAITAALVALGPGGMVGGLVTAGVLVLITAAVTAHGLPKVFAAVVRGFLNAGTPKDDLLGALKKIKLFLTDDTYNSLVRQVQQA